MEPNISLDNDMTTLINLWQIIADAAVVTDALATQDEHQKATVHELLIRARDITLVMLTAMSNYPSTSAHETYSNENIVNQDTKYLLN